MPSSEPRNFQSIVPIVIIHFALLFLVRAIMLMFRSLFFCERSIGNKAEHIAAGCQISFGVRSYLMTTSKDRVVCLSLISISSLSRLNCWLQ